MMKTIICKRPGELIVESIKKPIPKEGEVLIKIRAIGVCGTDIHAYGGNQPYFSYPRVLGHELAGEIIGLGKNVNLPIGKPVYVIPYIACGKCIACTKNKTNCCENISVIGVHRDGGMCEYIAVPENNVVITEGLPFKQLAIVECLAIGAHAVRRAQINKNDTVLVLGAGPIGLGAAQFAKVTGAKVFVGDVNIERLDFCLQEFAFDGVINSKTDMAKKLVELNDGEYPSVIIDATGNANAMNSTFKWLAHGGTIVFVSVVKADITFHDPEFHKRETTLMGSRNATKQDFEHVVNCIKKELIKSTNMITHKTSFSQFTTIFPLWVKPESGVVKAVIEL